MTAFRELSQHILDIFENGVKANAALMYLDIEEDLQANRLSITITDTGSGMDAEMVRRISDPWVTTRTTRKVGLGIPFFKQAAEMCDGSFGIESELGKGTRTWATFRYDHIDRPPLGDLQGTLLCMIVGYPQVGIVYRHRVHPAQEAEAREFVLDTREIREILGEDVELSDPDVVGFLKEMLAEGLAALEGEVRPGVQAGFTAQI